jgi:uncharacterized protein with HEPN domain
MTRDDARLLDMQRRAQRVQRHVAGMTKAAFLRDEKTQSAVLYELAIIGEAVKRLSGEFRAPSGDAVAEDGGDAGYRDPRLRGC